MTLFAALFALPTAFQATAEDFRIVTDDSWPFKYLADGEVVGIGPDQIAEISARTGLEMPIEVLPWSRALFLAENEPGNNYVITTAQIDERPERFAWVGPPTTEQDFLVRAVGSDIMATTLDQAPPPCVGVVDGDFLAAMLESEGFEALDVGAELSLNARKLVAQAIST